MLSTLRWALAGLVALGATASHAQDAPPDRAAAAEVEAPTATPADADDAPPAIDEAPASPPTATDPSLPDDPALEEAKAAYNGGRYADAVKAFNEIARRHPRAPAVYRALARAATYADQPETAVRAYRHYLALATNAPDREKIEAELALVARKADDVSAGPPEAVAQALSSIKDQVDADRFGGESGALATLAALSAGDYVGPELAEARELVHGGLRSRSEVVITRWWAADAQAKPRRLAALADGWAALATQGPLDRDGRTYAAATQGLSHLAADRYAEAVEALAPAAPGDPRLRYAQALALAKAERFHEAEQLLVATMRAVDDPRVPGLLGFVRRKLGQIDPAIDAWKTALEPSSGER